MQLIIAEKPSVAQSIAAVMGATERKDGYIQGGGYIVSWCIGHLVGLAAANAYDEKYQKWRQEDLPILPGDWQYTVAADKKKQFNILRELINRADVESLVCATDAGREGELIFRFVYHVAGCKKPFNRLWISSMEESAIRQGFDNLRDGSEYDPLYYSALCRAKADWLIGINATRLFSVLYGKTLNVGRVQTPTLAMLTERSANISGFQKEKYHHVHIAAGELDAISEKIPAAEDAQAMQTACHEGQAVCVSVTTEQKTMSPPKLFDLTALQRDANRLFGYTAKQTLDLAQTLYEKKLLTYPRTDSRFLTSDMEQTTPVLVNLAALAVGFIRGKAAVTVENIGSVINDAKVSDHHAIIPTMSIQGFDMSTLPETERSILTLVCTRLLCAVHEKHIYEAVTAGFECSGNIFTAKGKTVVAEGWKAVDRLFRSSLKLKDEDDGGGAEAEKALQPITEGQTFESVVATVTEHFTQPPKPYTEDTLLSAMEHAGAEDTTDDAERKGLGTPATRAAVIEKLVSSGFVQRKGKQLLPTQDGNNMIAILPDVLTSPMLTAEWENALTQIAKGAADPDTFMRDIESMAKGLCINFYKADEDKKALFRQDKETIGTCPRCGKPVYEGKKNFYCSNRDCSFTMWKNDRFFENRKKQLTKPIAAALLADGKAKVKGLYSEKTGKTFDATVLLADTGGKYVNYRFERSGS
ncbi:DNA topoisomerase 3 [Ruminococcaceae bacterium OttesenSCG-928-N02]|nr:DNA topoisomerase 3 [Ruminococcaceae bacterium OttesenSCG-928-N02]